MKKAIITAVFIVLLFPVYAQTLRAGLNLANVTISDAGRIDNSRMIPSFQLGVTTDIPLGSDFYIQPGILFTGKGSKTEAGQTSDQNYYRATTNPFYIEVPVNLLFKTSEGPVQFFIGAGPYAAVGIAGSNEVSGKYLGNSFSSKEAIDWSNDNPLTPNYEEDAGLGRMRRFDFGLNGIAGLEFEKMVLGINYGLGLTKLQSGTNSGTDDNNKHRVFSIMIGVKL